MVLKALEKGPRVTSNASKTVGYSELLIRVEGNELPENVPLPCPCDRQVKGRLSGDPPHPCFPRALLHPLVLITLAFQRNGSSGLAGCTALGGQGASCIERTGLHECEKQRETEFKTQTQETATRIRGFAGDLFNGGLVILAVLVLRMQLFMII